MLLNVIIVLIAVGAAGALIIFGLNASRDNDAEQLGERLERYTSRDYTPTSPDLSRRRPPGRIAQAVDMVDAQATIEAKAHLPVIPPRVGLGRLFEQAECVGQAQVNHAAEGGALRRMHGATDWEFSMEASSSCGGFRRPGFVHRRCSCSIRMG